jgi:protein ImuB
LYNTFVNRHNRRGLAVRLAIAGTLGAAWGLAHYGETPCVVPAGDDSIRSLPVAALRLEDQSEILVELGVKRIGKLLALPCEALACRFGPEFLRSLNQALGIVVEPIVSHRQPPEIEVETRLERPIKR